MVGLLHCCGPVVRQRECVMEPTLPGGQEAERGIAHAGWLPPSTAFIPSRLLAYWMALPTFRGLGEGEGLAP